MLTHPHTTHTQVRVNEERVADLVATTRPDLSVASARTVDLLTRLAAGAAAHSRADSSIGILHDILSQAPHLATDARRLERDHRELPSLLLELRMRAKALQADIEEALGRLDQHQRLADHLVYEAFATDLGDGD